METWPVPGGNKSRRSTSTAGFCVSLFTSMKEQLNHIDNEHFKQRKHIHAWDFNQVIRGLLLQPRVNSILRSMFGNDYTITQGFNWDPFTNQHLHERIEISEVTPNALASAAINQGGHPSQHGPAEISFMTRYSSLQPQMAPQAPTMHYQNALTQPYPGTDSFGADVSEPDRVDVPLEQQFDSAGQGLNWFHSDLSYAKSPNPDIFGGTSHDAPMEGYQLPDQVVPPTLPPDDGSGLMPAKSVF
ncbi:hypothetical protein ABVK25_004882 [Lepraria finkii]|uniref:Uncharacterized protein n=1 Tax=Lepraria finkii TaxID=1340010 RepID=A0ABR4BBC8_9LECA